MSAAQATEPTIHNQGVTKISTNARIDYVLRFSKHAVLMIDNDSSICSEVSNQFLAALSDENNAAYIALSNKLNDIQIRCRIIEQLFPNTLFDPEQSLAVTIFNLAKQQTKGISIVAENMQNGSLQLLHELSQLAILAKKANLNINVVLAGNTEVGTLVAQNSHLFEKNLSILLAKTGQLLPFSSPLFKVRRSLFTPSMGKKVLLSFAILSTIAVAVVVSLYQMDSINFSQLPEQNSLVSEIAEAKTEFVLSEQTIIVTPEVGIQPEQQRTINQTEISTAGMHQQGAQVSDIYLALQHSTQKRKAAEVVSKPQPANGAEISQAIMSTFDSKALVGNEMPNAEAAIQTPGQTLTFQGMNTGYYLEKSTGLVIQLSGFSQQAALDDFLFNYRDMTVHGYTRLINDKAMLMLTSEVFTDRNSAEAYLLSLPEAIKNLRPFIKSVNTVNSEINSFESSQ